MKNVNNMMRLNRAANTASKYLNRSNSPRYDSRYDDPLGYDSRYDKRYNASRLDDNRHSRSFVEDASYYDSSRGLHSPRGMPSRNGRSFVGPKEDGAVWTGTELPPPKNNLTHINRDMSLGGEMFRPSKAPLSKFAKATKWTPQSRTFHRVIPWDNKKKDFVYGAVHEDVLLGRTSRRRIKERIDSTRVARKAPDKLILPCLIAACLLLLIGLIIGIIIAIIWWTDFQKWWWVWLIIGAILFLIAIIMVVLAVVMTNSAIKKRETAIIRECDRINRSSLNGSGVKIVPGPHAAFLSLYLERGAYERWYDQQHRPSFVKGSPKVNVVKEKIVRDPMGHVVEKTTTVDELPNGISTPRRMSPQRMVNVNYDSRVPRQYGRSPGRSINLMG